MTTEILVGLDLGTTSSKAVARDLLDRQSRWSKAATPWTTVPGGTETTPERCSRSRQPVDRRRAPGGGARRAGARRRRRRDRPGRERRAARRRRRALRSGDRLVRPARRAGAGAGRGQGPLPAGAVRPPHRPALGLPGQPCQAAVAAAPA